MGQQKVLCLLLVAFAVVCGQTIQEKQCSKSDNTVEIQPGSSAWLGGIISLSQKGTNGYGCGEPYGSMQALEAMRWVLDLLNKKDEFLQTEYLDNTYVPGVTLGMKVVNNCYSTRGGVAGIAQIYDGLSGSSNECAKQNDKMVFGIIGGSSSDQSIDLSLALQPEDIPLISYEATAPVLTTSGMYPNFMRTVPPDSALTEVIVQVMLKMNWKYIAVVYDTGTYGKAAYSELLTWMVKNGLCLTVAVPVDGSDQSDGNMDSTLNRVLSTEATGVVFFGDQSLAKSLLSRAGDDSRISDTGRLQWIMADFPLESGLSIPYMRGVITVTLAYRFIVEFEDHWVRLDESSPSAENPWFQPWFAKKYECSFTPTPGQKDCKNLNPGLSDFEKEKKKRQEYQQDQFVEPAVMAVYTYARALRNAQQDKCPNKDACPALVNMPRDEFYENYVKKVDFSFSSDERVPSLASKNILPYNAAKKLSFTDQGDIEQPSFFVWNYNDIESGNPTGDYKFKRVGTYLNQYLEFNSESVAMYNVKRDQRLLPNPSSPCPNPVCAPCLGLPSDIKYYYEPGDLVLTGIFSIHNEGSTAMTCGDVKSPNQAMFLEAMIYAIKAVNADSSILPNIRLGGLGLDDCSSKATGHAILSNIHRGNLMIRDASQNSLNPRTIEAYTAAHTSPLTDPLAAMMNEIKRPLVGYRAGSVELDNQEMYPYFIRSAPYIREEVKATILLLKNYGWMYVQMVTSDQDYAIDAYKLFREMAAKEGICVVATHNLGSSDLTASNAVRNLGSNSEVPVTVALMETMDQKRLLTALHANQDVRKGITLIASSGWGINESFLDGMKSTAEGVITISPERSTLRTFQNYLKGLDAESYTKNPWFQEWFSKAYGCSLTSASVGIPKCDLTKDLDDGVNFELIYEVINIINSVKALAQGLDKALESYCGVGYTGVCSAFNNGVDKGSKFMENLRQVSFPIEDMAPSRMFSFAGSSAAIPFMVNNFKNSLYANLGTIRPSEMTVSLSMDAVLFDGASPSSIQPKCSEPCLECLYMFNYQDFIHVPGDVMLAAIFDVHEAGTGPFMCGDLRRVNGAIYTEAFNFAVDSINRGIANVKLNNVKLGYLGYDGCSSPVRSMAILNRVNAGQMSLSSLDMASPNIWSWVTYNDDSTREAALFLQQQGMPLVSPFATLPELADKSKFTTLFRTVNSEAVIAKGMADYVNAMGWKYVFTLNSPDTSNREATKLFREYLKAYGICILAQYEFSTDGTMEVIVQSVLSGESQVVAVFAEPEKYIEDMLKTKNDLSNKKLTFIANRPWAPYDQSYFAMLGASGSVFFRPSDITVSAFLDYLRSVRTSSTTNPWLVEMYEAYFACDLPGSFSSRPDCSSTTLDMSGKISPQDIRVLSTIDAVFSLAEGIHLTLKEKCGNSYNSVCDKFLQDSDTRERLMALMDAESFNNIVNKVFRFINRESNQKYEFYRYILSGRTQLEGTLSINEALSLSGQAQLKSLYSDIKSECSGECLVCKDDDADIQNFSFFPGDMYIVGLFDVHKKGSTPFSCGELNGKHGVQLLEAFHYALDYVNSGKGIFADLDVQIGGIGLDMCQSPSRAANLVANIHSGKTVLRSGQTSVLPRSIDAYVATMDTESSVRVADILQQLQIPQISYGATGMDLLDRDKYSYFLRSVPADDKMGRAMVSYLKKFKYNNIQVIKTFDEIGEPGAEEFERLAKINLVCITKTFMVGEFGDVKADVDKVINDIQADSSAQVLVLWMKNPLPVLEVLNNYAALYENMLIVATDKWGGDPTFLDLPSISNIIKAKNLILLDVETADVPGFDTYLDKKTPDNYPVNPWFKEVYEMYQKCDWDAGTCNKYTTVPRLDDYVQDPYVLYVVNAVFSAALGIKGALRELCTLKNFGGMCNFYASNGERRQKVLHYLKRVNFEDDTHQPFFYTADGQSDRGFHFYNVTKEGNAFEYENVGSYNDTNFLKLDITYENDYNAVCDPFKMDAGLVDCTCPFKPDLPTRFMKKEEGGRGLSLVYVGDIHQAHPTNKYACGPINTGVDLHRLLAFFYAIERINARQNVDLPDSFQLNGVALDSCTSSLRLGQDVYNILGGNELCDSDDKGLVISPSSITAFIVDKDKNALPVSSMLSPQGITSISPTATHALLDDPFHHATFLRTQGSSQDVNRVILGVADQLDWNMLGVIYSDTPAHNSAKDSLLELASTRSNRMCVGSQASLSLNATLEDATNVLDEISQQIGVTGVVLFVEPAHYRLLMESSKALGSTSLVWIVPSNWATQEMDVQEYRSEASGSIWIQTKTSFLDDFHNYVKKLSLDNKMGIPDDWFQEIYEKIHNCKILDVTENSNRLYPNICTGDEKITDIKIIKDPSILHVVISVYAVAFGLNNIPQCKGTTLDMAACLQLQKDKYELIYNGILGVNFEVLPELLSRDQRFRFSFDGNGNGEAGYTVSTRNDEGTLIPLGDHSSQGLNVNLTTFNAGGVPSSRCAPGATCKCSGPNGRDYDFSPEGVKSLMDVQIGQRYKDPQTGRIILVGDIPQANDRFSTIWAIIMMVLAVIGCLLSLSMFIYLLVMYPIRGGTSILGYIISFGIFLLYLMVFAFIAHATKEICALRRFALGIVYAIVYGALLVKLIDCWRARGKGAAKYNKLGRPLGLFFITFFLVLVQAMINAEWLILEEPKVERVFYLDMYWPRCVPDDFYDQGLVLSLVYVMGIIFLSFVLGIFTFTQNVNHRESRWIFGVVILSIPCWVIWCIVAITGAYKVRDAAVAVGLLVNATIMLLLFPVRKLYLLHKYNAMIEEEDKQITNNDYASVYGRQYDNQPQMHSQGSVIVGSTHGYSSHRYGTAQKQY